MFCDRIKTLQTVTAGSSIIVQSDYLPNFPPHQRKIHEFTLELKICLKN